MGSAGSKAVAEDVQFAADLCGVVDRGDLDRRDDLDAEACARRPCLGDAGEGVVI